MEICYNKSLLLYRECRTCSGQPRDKHCQNYQTREEMFQHAKEFNEIFERQLDNDNGELEEMFEVHPGGFL